MKFQNIASQSRSPSFPSCQQISQDIFFQVKKQMLDKLDLILQQINLEVIQYLKLQGERRQQNQTFKFIQLSSFEKQIQHLFDYLDRLYSSLNSSVSFSSTDIKSPVFISNSNIQGDRKNRTVNSNIYTSNCTQQIQLMKRRLIQMSEQNFKLKQQNQHLKFIIKNSSTTSNYNELTNSFNVQSRGSLKRVRNQLDQNKHRKMKNDDIHYQSNAQTIIRTDSSSALEGISLQTVKKILRFYNHSIKQLSVQYREQTKQIKRLLKQAKFQIVQNRVECIAQLKKWSQKYSKDKMLFYNQNDLANKDKQRMKYLQKQQGQSQQNICGQECARRLYEQQETKNGFEENLLQRLQQILDVC